MILLVLGIFAAYQARQVALYFYHRHKNPQQPRRFPIGSFFVTFLCCALYAFALYMDTL